MQNDVGIVPNGIGASDLDKNLVRQAHGDLSIPGYPARAHAYLIGAGCLSESDPALLCLYHTRILSGVFDDFGIFQCIQSYLLYNNSVLNDQCGFSWESACRSVNSRMTAAAAINRIIKKSPGFGFSRKDSNLRSVNGYFCYH